MARYVATADATIDGITYPRGSVLNVPTSATTLNSNADLGTAIPRVRPAGLEFNPLHYQTVAFAPHKMERAFYRGRAPPFLVLLQLPITRLPLSLQLNLLRLKRSHPLLM